MMLCAKFGLNGPSGSEEYFLNDVNVFSLLYFYIHFMMAYFCRYLSVVTYFCYHLSDNHVDLSELYVDLTNPCVGMSDPYVELSIIHYYIIRID